MHIKGYLVVYQLSNIASSCESKKREEEPLENFDQSDVQRLR